MFQPYQARKGRINENKMFYTCLTLLETVPYPRSLEGSSFPTSCSNQKVHLQKLIWNLKRDQILTGHGTIFQKNSFHIFSGDILLFRCSIGFYTLPLHIVGGCELETAQRWQHCAAPGSWNGSYRGAEDESISTACPLVHLIPRKTSKN